MKRFVLHFSLLMICFASCWAQETSQAVKAATSSNRAIFAGGCFWCMQAPFDKLDGVITTKVGYTGGPEENPTYEQVSNGRTAHLEAIEIIFDPKVISYNMLLETFWRNIDPTQDDGQFADIGTQYRSAIFYLDEEQNKIAQESKATLGKSARFQKPIVTEIRPASAFYQAEEYHQKYYEKNPADYNRYKVGSGRDAFIRKNWSVRLKEK